MGILDAIGGTALVELERVGGPFGVRAWAKLEAGNPGGSTKDRPAARMIRDAIRDGLITPWTTVIESTSGNMGVGLAQACRYHGVRLICVVDARATDRTVRMLRALGAEVRLVEEPDPETGDLLVARRKLVTRLLAEIPGSFSPDQYANESNPSAHASGTMREIDEALDGEIDYLFVATSTSGTLLGCCDYLRSRNRQTRVVAVDAAGSVLFGGTPGTRRLPGLGAGIETDLSRRVEFDELVRVSDMECVIGCRRLAHHEAILAGASAGGVVMAFDKIARRMARGDRCALIFADGGSGYLTTVYDDDWVESELGCTRDELAALV